MRQKDQVFSVARVVAHHRGKYRVRTAERELWAEITGKMMYGAGSQADYPVVGDKVKISKLDGNHVLIHEVLPRKTILQRKAAGKDAPQIIATNIDVAFIVQAVDRDFNLNRFDRYLSIASAGKIKPVIVLNKIDLISKSELKEKVSQIIKRFKKIKILTTSVLDNNGIAELAKAIKKQKIYCFLGSSGVGKSSIINKLLGKNVLKTRNISISTKKGKHATTHRELFVLENGGMVIDNPGMREVGIADAGDGVESVFFEISRLAKSCKFSDCTHTHETGCRVLAAVDAREIDKSKYLNYLKLKKESDYYAMTKLEKRRKDQSFGKMVHKVMKHKRENR
ncbi:MAG: ribosome small subunit-dependent GTPase A [Candidatus Saganbacteria bacterium]|nr:ribosome small subunit-dependent GTPase A [Candidatus Saganbacteria bacterium]